MIFWIIIVPALIYLWVHEKQDERDWKFWIFIAICLAAIIFSPNIYTRGIAIAIGIFGLLKALTIEKPVVQHDQPGK